MAATDEVPRGEHPRPQFVRGDWINLNGTWSFALDPGRSGSQRGLHESSGFDRAILVPFAPESDLSGVGHKDFIECLWYHRTLAVPASWRGRRVLLHFGAVDFEAEVFIDGRLAGRHWGGSSSFTLDVTLLVSPGATHELVVHVRDDIRGGRQARGKQCPDFASRNCLYTRTTGIWQTVWMEAVADGGLAGVQVLGDVDGGRFVLAPTYRGGPAGRTLRATLTDGEAVVAQATVAAADAVACALPLDEPKCWSPDSPLLYGLLLEVLDADGAAIDRVESYAGLRKVHVDGGRVFLNNEPISLRLVLDQGFYPDGIWTAPSDEALRRDIELSMAAGFNGARLHQKVFEERFHTWADRLGYLTWGESASWGMAMWSDAPDDLAAASAWNFLSEWREIVVRDRNHPSIIAWTPFNETCGGAKHARHGRLHVEAYELSHALDPTRPVNDTSGYVHARTDLWTVHNYEQDAAKLRETLAPGDDGGVWRNWPDLDAPYEGQPYLVDEFGGIKWIPPERRPFSESSWGYGEGPKTLEEFYERLAGLVGVLDGLEHVAGWCYTQLTDVEQEQNGIYTYDRREKFDMARIRRILSGQGD